MVGAAALSTALAALGLVLVMRFVVAADGGAALVSVDPETVLNPDVRHRLGVNVNYLLDNQERRPAGARPLADALLELGATYARYPGGEKADGYLWSVPPFERPEPGLARLSGDDWPSNDLRYWSVPGSADGTWAQAVHDFDDFMADCSVASCEPVVVIAYDGIYKAANAGGTALTRSQAMDTAVGWVNYANIVAGYGVKYWEIGNETWQDSYAGSSPGASQYGRDVVEFSRAMKAVDPSIDIGVNGDSEDWFAGVLAEAADDVDFLALHSYPSSGLTLPEYQSGTALTSRPLVDAAASALMGFSTARDRIFIAVTETGVLDRQADMGSALMLFDTIGDLLEDRRVAFSLFWGTRWVEGPGSGGSGSSDALDADNELGLMGLVVALWRRYATGRMVAAESDRPSVGSYASYDPAAQVHTIYLVNKAERADATIEVAGLEASGSADVVVLAGVGVADEEPSMTLRSLTVAGSTFEVELPAHSVSIVQIPAA